MIISNLGEIWTNTALFEFGPAKSNMTAALIKNEVQRRLSKYFRFHPSVLHGPFTKWVYNKLKQYTSYFYFMFYNVLKYTIIPSFAKRFMALDQGGSNP